MMKLLSVVAILVDVPEHGIVRGQVGTIVESLSPTVWYVEFSDSEGRTCALVEAEAKDLIALQFEPMQQAA